MTPAAATDRLTRAVADGGVRDRYLAKIASRELGACWLWTGAVSGRGHGRFWIREGLVVIAHRYGYALQHGVDALPDLLSHACDNPLCQNPHDGHLTPSTPARNRAEWDWRRRNLGSPLRDLRGARGRAVALRDAARDGDEVAEVAAAGLGPLDTHQDPLWPPA